MRISLRTAPDLHATYLDRPHDHWQYEPNYHRRAYAMVDTAARCRWPITSLADLSAGNGLIAWTAASVLGLAADDVHLGDVFAGWRYQGVLDITINQVPHVDLFVSGETLEHVPEPDAMLAAIRRKATLLLLSTPVDNWHDDNPEHLHAWDKAEVDAMLAEAGFTRALAYQYLPDHGGRYAYGLWLVA